METKDELPPSYEPVSSSYYEPYEVTLHRHPLLLLTTNLLLTYW